MKVEALFAWRHSPAYNAAIQPANFIKIESEPLWAPISPPKAKGVSAGGDRSAGVAPCAYSPGRCALRLRLRELAGERRWFRYRHLGGPLERAGSTFNQKKFLANLRVGWLEGQGCGFSRSGNSDRLHANCHDNFPSGKVDRADRQLATAVWEPANQLCSRSSDD